MGMVRDGGGEFRERQLELEVVWGLVWKFSALKLPGIYESDPSEDIDSELNNFSSQSRLLSDGTVLHSVELLAKGVPWKFSNNTDYYQEYCLLSSN